MFANKLYGNYKGVFTALSMTPGLSCHEIIRYFTTYGRCSHGQERYSGSLACRMRGSVRKEKVFMALMTGDANAV
jgi:hypothetical protein